MNPRVFVVILTWNHKDVTAECLKSVLDLNYQPLEVVVVDNHSLDGTPDLIRHRFPGVKLLVCNDNRGFAEGMNRGITYALEHGAEQVFILNNDTVLPPDLLVHLVKASQESRNQDVGIFVPKICCFEDKKRIWAAGARWRKFPPIVTMIGFKSVDRPQYNKPRQIEFATGCALLVRRQVFEHVGLFDPAFFMYHEDYDFCQRVRSKKYKILYVPSACLWHRVSTSTGEGSPQKWYYLAQSTVLFYHRYFEHPRPTLALISMWVFLRELIKGKISFFPHYWRGLQSGFEKQAVLREKN